MNSSGLFDLFAHAQCDEVVGHPFLDAPLAGQQPSQSVEQADHLPMVRPVVERRQVIVEGQFGEAGRVAAFPTPEVHDADVGLQGDGGVVMFQRHTGLAVERQQLSQRFVAAEQVVADAREQMVVAGPGRAGQGAFQVRGRQGPIVPAEVQFPTQ